MLNKNKKRMVKFFLLVFIILIIIDDVNAEADRRDATTDVDSTDRVHEISSESVDCGYGCCGVTGGNYILYTTGTNRFCDTFSANYVCSGHDALVKIKTPPKCPSTVEFSEGSGNFFCVNDNHQICKVTEGGNSEGVIKAEQCSIWQPPERSSDCYKCGNDDYCNEYECRLLGKECNFKSNIGFKGFCAKKECEDKRICLLGNGDLDMDNKCDAYDDDMDEDGYASAELGDRVSKEDVDDCDPEIWKEIPFEDKTGPEITGEVAVCKNAGNINLRIKARDESGVDNCSYILDGMEETELLDKGTTDETSFSKTINFNNEKEIEIECKDKKNNLNEKIIKIREFDELIVDFKPCFNMEEGKCNTVDNLNDKIAINSNRNMECKFKLNKNNEGFGDLKGFNELNIPNYNSFSKSHSFELYRFFEGDGVYDIYIECSDNLCDKKKHTYEDVAVSFNPFSDKDFDYYIISDEPKKISLKGSFKGGVGSQVECSYGKINKVVGETSSARLQSAKQKLELINGFTNIKVIDGTSDLWAFETDALNEEFLGQEYYYGVICRAVENTNIELKQVIQIDDYFDEFKVLISGEPIKNTYNNFEGSFLTGVKLSLKYNDGTFKNGKCKFAQSYESDIDKINWDGINEISGSVRTWDEYSFDRLPIDEPLLEGDVYFHFRCAGEPDKYDYAIKSIKLSVNYKEGWKGFNIRFLGCMDELGYSCNDLEQAWGIKITGSEATEGDKCYYLCKGMDGFEEPYLEMIKTIDKFVEFPEKTKQENNYYYWDSFGKQSDGSYKNGLKLNEKYHCWFYCKDFDNVNYRTKGWLEMTTPELKIIDPIKSNIKNGILETYQLDLTVLTDGGYGNKAECRITNALEEFYTGNREDLFNKDGKEDISEINNILGEGKWIQKLDDEGIKPDKSNFDKRYRYHTKTINFDEEKDYMLGIQCRDEANGYNSKLAKILSFKIDIAEVCEEDCSSGNDCNDNCGIGPCLQDPDCQEKTCEVDSIKWVDKTGTEITKASKGDNVYIIFTGTNCALGDKIIYDIWEDKKQPITGFDIDEKIDSEDVTLTETAQGVMVDWTSELKKDKYKTGGSYYVKVETDFEVSGLLTISGEEITCKGCAELNSGKTACVLNNVKCTLKCAPYCVGFSGNNYKCTPTETQTCSFVDGSTTEGICVNNNCPNNINPGFVSGKCVKNELCGRDYDDDLVEDALDCNDNNGAIGQCKGCAVCYQDNDIITAETSSDSGECLKNDLLCSATICTDGCVGSDYINYEQATIPNICSVTNNVGTCSQNSCVEKSRISNGCVENKVPIANAGADQNVNLDINNKASVQFDASGSRDPDNDALTYSWEFGDGTIGSGIKPVHVYTSVGSYNVILTVDDNRGGKDTDTVIINVNPYTGPCSNDKDCDGVLDDEDRDDNTLRGCHVDTFGRHKDVDKDGICDCNPILIATPQCDKCDYTTCKPLDSNDGPTKGCPTDLACESDSCKNDNYCKGQIGGCSSCGTTVLGVTFNCPQNICHSFTNCYWINGLWFANSCNSCPSDCNGFDKESCVNEDDDCSLDCYWDTINNECKTKPSDGKRTILTACDVNIICSDSDGCICSNNCVTTGNISNGQNCGGTPGQTTTSATLTILDTLPEGTIDYNIVDLNVIVTGKTSNTVDDPTTCYYTKDFEDAYYFSDAIKMRIQASTNKEQEGIFGEKVLIPYGSNVVKKHYLKEKLRLGEGHYIYYARCSDGVSVAPELSKAPATIDFTIAIPPTKRVDIIDNSFGPLNEYGSKNVRIYVETRGGINNGASTGCSYSGSINGELTPKFDEVTKTYVHEATRTLSDGAYSIIITCSDGVTSDNTGQFTFGIKQDTAAPQIVQIVSKGTKNYVMTNEKSVCYASANKEGGWSELTSEANKHWITLRGMYYVKCNDLWGNSGGIVGINPPG